MPDRVVYVYSGVRDSFGLQSSDICIQSSTGKQHNALNMKDLLITHCFVNEPYYIESSPRVDYSHRFPFEHYVKYGWKKDFSPNPLFVPQLYNLNIPFPSAVPAYIHFCGTGSLLGFDPHPLFSNKYYKDSANLNKRPGIGLLVHYLEIGLIDLISPHPFFDPNYYNDQICKLQNDNVYGLDHYLFEGWRQGLNPHPFFDTSYYIKNNPHVAEEGINPLLHFVTQGVHQGCSPHPLIPEQYIRPHPGKLGVDDWVNLLKHWKTLHSLASVLRWRFEHDAVSTICSDLRLPAKLCNITPNREVLDKLVCEVDNLVKKQPLTQLYDVSIIIPVKDNLLDTLGCLRSILLFGSNYSYQVIIGDDCSEQSSMAILQQLQGGNVKVLRHPETLGFVLNCNECAKAAEGQYLLFLNNDTIVTPGWLDDLIDTFVREQKIGLVGSKLINIDGSLQESGGVVWNNAHALNVGRGDDPCKPMYSYMRPVDYCSGAAIAIRSSLWTTLHGFDPGFAPAYYEDTDLAFRVRATGYLTVVQPTSWVIHFEGASNGTSLDAGLKKYQEVNRHNFYSKWQTELPSHPAPVPDFDFQDIDPQKKTVIVIDHSTPKPDHDSGSIDASLYVRCLIEYGCHVIFVPADLQYAQRYTEDLQRIGVECMYMPFVNSFDDVFRAIRKRVDLVLIFRFNVAKAFLPKIKEYLPLTKVVLESVDLHHLREMRRADISKLPADYENAIKIKEDELSVINQVDATIILSEYELKIIRRELPAATLIHIPIPRDSLSSQPIAIQFRKDILFIGGFNHHPNLDGIVWFIENVWPILKSLGYPHKLIIAGSDTPEVLYDYASEHVEVIGFVKDINPLYEQCRATIAPLRYGAGLKGKVIESLQHGVPCISTRVGVEGSGITNDIHALIADDPDSFAVQIMRLVNDDELWSKLSINGKLYFDKHYSVAAVFPKIHRLLKSFNI